MFLISNIVGAIFLAVEAMLAYLAFGGLTNPCVRPESVPENQFEEKFPCQVSGLYNENFLDLPLIGALCNFYPMMNIAAVPILNITLRNNLLEAFPIKAWIKKKGKCLFLLKDHKNKIKGIWSIILTIPVIVIVLFYRNVQSLITWTGGVGGTFIILILPTTLVVRARRLRAEKE